MAFKSRSLHSEVSGPIAANFEKELEFAITTARAAGKIAMDHSNSELVVHPKGSQGDIVTEGDLATDRFIISQITQAFPKDSILTEESGDDVSRLQNRRVWIVDPVDGTKNYREFSLSNGKNLDFQYFAVHIALAVDGKVVAGVVFNPATDELYFASLGNGAYKVVGENAPVRLIINPEKVSGVPVIINWKIYDNPNTSAIAEGFPRIVKPFNGVYGYHLAAIADGRIGGYAVHSPEDPLAEWDVCAPHIILTEAGGQITDLYGRPLVYNKKVAKFPLGVIAVASAGIIPILPMRL